VDLVPLPRDPFTRQAFDRRQRLAYGQEGHSAMFIAPTVVRLANGPGSVLQIGIEGDGTG
jgi:hypothetical protein